MRRYTVLLADDHPVYIIGLERLLESQFEIVGKVHDGVALVAEGARLRPDLIVADISMPLLTGLDAARSLSFTTPASKLVFLTMHDDPVLVREAMESGARAYILKSNAAGELVDTLRQVIENKTHFPLLPARLPGNHHECDISPELLTAKLTARQREILRLIAQGKTHKEIANSLHMSPKTVEFHKYRMTRVLGLQTTAELTRAAVRAHLVDL